MNYGEAIEMMKLGYAVCRADWTCTYVVLIRPNATATDAYFSQWTERKTWQPGWLASTPDMLAEDWEIFR